MSGSESEAAGDGGEGEGWTIALRRSPTDSRTLTAVADVSIGIEHTALATFSATVAGDGSLRAYLGADVTIAFDGREIFDGELDTVSGEHDSPKVAIAGRGPLGALTGDERSYLIDQRRADRAIEAFWRDETPFDVTVRGPPGEERTETAAEAVSNDRGSTTDGPNPDPFEQILTIRGEDPFEITDRGVELLHTGYLAEAEDGVFEGDPTITSPGDGSTGASGDAYVTLDEDDEVAVTFETQYSMPSDASELAIRARTAPSATSRPIVQFRLDGKFADQRRIRANADGWNWYRTDALTPELREGESTIRIGLTGGGQELDVDLISLTDSRFEHTFDNTLDANNALAGPEPYPDFARVPLNTASTGSVVRRPEPTVEFDRSARGESGEQAYPRLGFTVEKLGEGADGDPIVETTTRTREVSQQSDTVDDIGLTDLGTVTRFEPILELGRADEPQLFDDREQPTTTPTGGTFGQRLVSLEFDAQVLTVPIFDSREFEGSDLDILRTMHEDARMRFAYQHGPATGLLDPNVAVDVESFPAGADAPVRDLPDDAIVTGYDAEQSVESYANRVIVRGASTVVGDISEQSLQQRILERQRIEIPGIPRGRYSGSAEATEEILARGRGDYSAGVETYRIDDRTLTTDADCASVARAVLRDRLNNDAAVGTVETLPRLVLPGYRYRVAELSGGRDDSNAIGLQATSYEQGRDGSSATLDFRRSRGVIDALAGAISDGQQSR